MESERVRLCEIVVGEYRVLLRMEGSVLLPTKHQKIRAFYERIFANTLKWGKELLGKELCRAYALLSDTRQKARFPTTHAFLSCEILYDDGVFAIIRATARWSGKKEGEFSYSCAWRLYDEAPLLLCEVKKHEKLREYVSIFGEKARKKIVKKLAK